jgi:Acetoacetate decarboxylase (ADC)
VLSGSADPARWAGRAPRIPSFDVEPARLDDVQIFQTMVELPMAVRTRLLPPGLHPTNPPTLILWAWRCGGSRWGAFSLVQLRVGCRSGVRTRGLVVACACDSTDAAAGLAEHWGLGSTPARIGLDARYDATALTVERDGREILRAEASRPEPLDPGDVQYTGTLTFGSPPAGLRLVQLEPRFELERAERLTPGELQLDAAAWGEPDLEPRHPVSASLARGQILLPRVRFVCRPDVPAFQGTEAV